MTAVVALTLVSGGLYIAVWFPRRREALNLLDSPAKLWAWGPRALLTAQMTLLVLPQGRVDSNVAQLCAAIIILVLSFRVRTMLGDRVKEKMTGVILY